MHRTLQTAALPNLPIDVQLRIFRHLDVQDLCVITAVSRAWRSLCSVVEILDIKMVRNVEQIASCDSWLRMQKSRGMKVCLRWHFNTSLSCTITLHDDSVLADQAAVRLPSTQSR